MGITCKHEWACKILLGKNSIRYSFLIIIVSELNTHNNKINTNICRRTSSKKMSSKTSNSNDENTFSTKWSFCEDWSKHRLPKGYVVISTYENKEKEHYENTHDYLVRKSQGHIYINKMFTPEKEEIDYLRLQTEIRNNFKSKALLKL